MLEQKCVALGVGMTQHLLPYCVDNRAHKLNWDSLPSRAKRFEFHTCLPHM